MATKTTKSKPKTTKVKTSASSSKKSTSSSKKSSSKSSNKKKTTSTKKKNTKSSNGTFSAYESKDAQYKKNLAKAINGSTRLYGIPHQFLPHNDPRIGDDTGVAGLGELYAEKIVLEAPIVHIKPGKSKFMPGSNSSMKKGMLNALGSAVKGEYSDLEQIINSESQNDDVIKYFGFKEDFSNYMTKVNLLCRFMAHFMGLADTKVPWATNVNFGHYDWRYYKFNKTMSSKSSKMGANGNGVGTFISDVFETASKSISTDDMYISFYVDSNASFSESASNSTTQSVIKQYTDQVSSMAKELQTVSNISGLDAQGLAQSVSSSLDSYAQSLQGDGALTSFFKRLTGTTNQLIQGANFLVPDIWSDSDYSRSYSVPIVLTTPYGNKLSWYLNIGVPLCFILGMALPHGSTANTYTSPCLIQAFSQGWFNCELGIIDSIGIDKDDDTWNASGLPNTIKISLNIRDLYQSLTLPKANNALGFMQNTGMLEFLLINSGVDLTVSSLSNVWKVWQFIFRDQLSSKIQAAPYDLLISLRNKMNTMGKLLK